MMRLDLERFIKAQQAEKSNAINSIQHQSQSSPSPTLIVVSVEDRCFTQSVDRVVVVLFIEAF